MLNGEEHFSWMYNDEDWNNLMVEHKLKRLSIKMCCCESDGHMRRSSLGTKHFFHASGYSKNCKYTEESKDHLLIKSTIAEIALRYTPNVDTEHKGPNWKADVFCQHGLVPIVFEVQLSRISISDLLIRDKKYTDLGFESYWLVPNNKKITGITREYSVRKIFRFDIDENAQDTNNRYIFSKIIQDPSSKYILGNINGYTLSDVIKSIFDARVNKRIKKMEEYQRWLKTNPFSAKVKPVRPSFVDTSENYKLVPEEPCINMMLEEEPIEELVVIQRERLSPFEKKCLQQSKWEQDQGKWQYTKTEKGLIIPTYNP